MLGRGETRSRPSGGAAVYWRVECVCGRTAEISGTSLREGTSKSCGCRVVEAAEARSTHGEARRGHRTAEYQTWISIRARCLNANNKLYKYYGGRGVGMCDRWRNSYTAFLQDVGRKPFDGASIDRIDNNRSYEPGNVRWATQKQQCRNQRKTRWLTVGGVTRPLTEWAELANLNYKTIHTRLSAGYSDEEAVYGKKT